MSRQVEMNLSKQGLKEHIEQYLRAVRCVNNDEDVVISFNTRHLKTDDEEVIPVSLTMYKFKEVTIRTE